MCELYDYLQKADLATHYDTLVDKGMSVSRLATLTMQDYNDFGVQTMADRKKLFQLIQTLKRRDQSVDALKENVPPPVNRQQGFVDQVICDPVSVPAHVPLAVPPVPVPAPVQQAPLVQQNSPRAPVATASVAKPVSTKKGPRIRVAVRIRPLTPSEQERGDTNILQTQDATILVQEKRTAVDLTQYTCPHEFTFDEVFAPGSDNNLVYSHTALPLIDTVFEGGRATCFAYGQTGSGKTHTMLGKGTATGSGLYALAARDIFARLGPEQFCTCNYYEIYGNKCYDLLQGRARCEVREDGSGQVNICGLTDHHVDAVAALMQIIEEGSAVRAQGSTSANIDSSRSHAVLCINVRGPAPQVTRKRGREDALFGRFSFIDLAGSERGSDAANSEKITRTEGAEINKSLLALKECIRALDQAARHVPFRGSKLTEVLRESFVGNSRTAMIACVAPGTAASDDTLNTMRYADRVKSLTRPAKERQATDDFDPITMTGNVSKGRKVRRAAKTDSPRGTRARAAEAPARSATASAAAVQRQASAMQRVPLRPQGQERPRRSVVAPEVQKEVTPPAPQQIDTPRVIASSEDSMDIDISSPPPPGLLPDTWGAQQQPQQQQQQGGNPVQVQQKHQELINDIIQQEEELISFHRTHVDDVMALIRQEMAELNSVDQPGSSIDAYTRNVDTILKTQIDRIGNLRDRLRRFKKNLLEEERLSQIVAEL
eukprot:Hpha_TRINITY_DN15616_c4_g3::TRINITY_DN15616_c4_g3_i1::g.101714::m.101714/K10393/KIF2_24, MCAK; kinesin family member 2/24